MFITDEVKLKMEKKEEKKDHHSGKMREGALVETSQKIKTQL